MGRFDLAIFDMDGTLVDSEPLATSTLAVVLNSCMGLQLDGTEVAETYGGRDLEFMIEDVMNIHGIDEYPQNFRTLLADAYTQIAEMSLKPTAGMEETLEALAPIRRCVASNGEADYIKFSLDTVDLSKYFEATFSVADVARPKPAPDLYLHAAAELGIEPARCIVVEDRELGINAALAAGMTAVGFAGNCPARAPSLSSLGVTVISDMRDFVELALS